MRCGRPSQESRCADRGCIANLRLRASAGCCGLQAEGVLWLAHGFGTLDLVRADKEDLSIGRSPGGDELEHMLHVVQVWRFLPLPGRL